MIADGHQFGGDQVARKALGSERGCPLRRERSVGFEQLDQETQCPQDAGRIDVDVDLQVTPDESGILELGKILSRVPEKGIDVTCVVERYSEVDSASSVGSNLIVEDLVCDCGPDDGDRESAVPDDRVADDPVIDPVGDLDAVLVRQQGGSNRAGKHLVVVVGDHDPGRKSVDADAGDRAVQPVECETGEGLSAARGERNRSPSVDRHIISRNGWQGKGRSHSGHAGIEVDQAGTRVRCAVGDVDRVAQRRLSGRCEVAPDRHRDDRSRLSHAPCRESEQRYERDGERNQDGPKRVAALPDAR
ncbi:MAG: hypothetical protein LC732_09850 [Acidobacteria bacterium]|nr:hypothetical protein [Acidobacteriota bacterium]